MWENCTVETACDRQEVAGFLSNFGLHYDFDSDLTVVVRRDDKVIATGSLRGNVLQCLAVEPHLQGEGISAAIVSRLLEVAFDRGHTRVFVFTHPGNDTVLKGLGFRSVIKTPYAAFLETGVPSIVDYVNSLAEQAFPSCVPLQGTSETWGRFSCFTTGSRGGLVMNCNPFTLGHQYLVERAAAECDNVFVLIVEENRSAFPFDVRMELARRGTAHLPNVTLLPSGPYSVSLATFPSYFSSEEISHARAGASVDAAIYGKYLAPTLGISRRYVGTEPHSPVTAIYNEVMREVLGQYGVELIEVPRLEAGGKAISALSVREALRTGRLQDLGVLVPATTRDFLLSQEADGIVSHLKAHAGRH